MSKEKLMLVGAGGFGRMATEQVTCKSLVRVLFSGSSD